MGRISRAEAWEALGGHGGFFGKWEDWSPEVRQQVWDQLGTPEKEAIWALFAGKPHCLPEPVPVEQQEAAPVDGGGGMAALVENESDMPEGMVKEARAARIARNHGVERAGDLLAEDLARGEIPALQKNGVYWLKLEDLDAWILARLDEARAEHEDEPLAGQEPGPDMELRPGFTYDEVAELEQQLIAQAGTGGVDWSFNLQMIFYAIVTIVSLWALGWVFVNGV